MSDLSLPPMLEGDWVRLRQIINILALNLRQGEIGGGFSTSDREVLEFCFDRTLGGLKTEDGYYLTTEDGYYLEYGNDD